MITTLLNMKNNRKYNINKNTHMLHIFKIFKKYYDLILYI